MIDEYDLRRIETEAQGWMLNKQGHLLNADVVSAISLIGATLPRLIYELRKVKKKYYCHWCEDPLDGNRERHPTKRYHIGCMRELLHYPHHTKKVYRRMMEAR